MLKSDVVSGYASLGSGESLEDIIEDETTNVVQKILTKLQDEEEKAFKSLFTKDFDKSERNNTRRTRSAVKLIKPTSDERRGSQYVRPDLRELARLRLENEQLKLKIQICLNEDERYEALRHEVGQLKGKLSQVV